MNLAAIVLTADNFQALFVNPLTSNSMDSLKPGSHVADDRRVIVSNHSRRKFTKNFTHEQSPTIVVADVGNI